VFRHSRRTSTEHSKKSHQSQVAVLRVFSGEVEEVDFARRVGRVIAVVEAGDADVVRHSDEQVLF
jgi:hypothetical protein